MSINKDIGQHINPPPLRAETAEMIKSTPDTSIPERGKFLKNFRKSVDICSYLCYNIITVRNTKLTSKRGKTGKGEQMEVMTDKQMSLILKMILEILEGCKDLDEAKEKIKALLEE